MFAACRAVDVSKKKAVEVVASTALGACPRFWGVLESACFGSVLPREICSQLDRQSVAVRHNPRMSRLIYFGPRLGCGDQVHVSEIVEKL